MNRTERHEAIFVAMRAGFAALAAKVDAAPFPEDGTKADGVEWVMEVLRLANGRMVRAGSPTPWPQPVNQTVDGIDVDHYRDTVGELSAALSQHVDIALGEPQKGCAICGDALHVADDCKRNPLLLMAFGAHALHGPTWKCFHCGSVYTDPENAAKHFGDSLENSAACVREQAEILTHCAEQLVALRRLAPELAEPLICRVDEIRQVRAWIVRARS